MNKRKWFLPENGGLRFEFYTMCSSNYLVFVFFSSYLLRSLIFSLLFSILSLLRLLRHSASFTFSASASFFHLECVDHVSTARSLGGGGEGQLKDDNQIDQNQIKNPPHTES